MREHHCTNVDYSQFGALIFVLSSFSLQTDSASIEANYKCLGLKPDEGITTFIPKRKQLEMEELCRQVKPTNYDEMVKRFRAALDTSITFDNRETVPERFTSVLREVILQQQVDEEERNRYHHQARPGLMARLLQRFYRSNTTGVVSDGNVEGGGLGAGHRNRMLTGWLDIYGGGTAEEEIELREGNRPTSNNKISTENMEMSRVAQWVENSSPTYRAPFDNTSHHPSTENL